MSDSEVYANSDATWVWDVMTDSYYGVIDAPDGRQLWACRHHHNAADGAFDCAVAEQTRGPLAKPWQAAPEGSRVRGARS